MNIAQKKEQIDALNPMVKLGLELLTDFKLFCRYFFRVVFCSEFQERPHVKIIQNELLKVYRGEILFLNINVHPGSFKSTLLIFFIAWSLAREPRAAFIYITYSFTLASDKTTNIFRIISHPHFKEMFGVEVDKFEHSKAKFKTTAGGGVLAAGSQGTITGFDAGRPDEDNVDGGSPPFLGGIVIDDSLKGSDAFSAAARKSIKDVYFQTIMTRRRGSRVPIISIAQRLHEDDLSAVFINKKDGKEWKNLILPFLKEDGEVLDPLIMSKEEFKKLQSNPLTAYQAASQYMQNPIPLGDTLFSRDDFKIIDKVPPLECVFITGDVAETDNMKNDATVFSGWGVFKIKYDGVDSGEFGLVWLDCVEVWVKPNELESLFMVFYSKLLSEYGRVDRVCIENKSMGVMLNSFLTLQPGVKSIPLIRSNKMSKLDRIAQAQPIVKGGLLCIHKNAIHKELVLSHMEKITQTKTNLLDDIADTLADAVNLVYFEKSMMSDVFSEDFSGIFEDLTRRIQLNSSKISIGRPYHDR